MACFACGRWEPGPLCTRCRRELRPAVPRALPSGLVARAAFLHEGPARRLVHRLKYEGLVVAAGFLAGVLAPLVPDDATALVPVPRVVWRRVRYGIDPAAELARALGSRCRLPVVAALVPPLVGRRHAGRSRSDRTAPIFSVRQGVPTGAVLVDDVVTTGVTLQAAASVLGTVGTAVTVTAARPVTSLRSGGRE